MNPPRNVIYPQQDKTPQTPVHILWDILYLTPAIYYIQALIDLYRISAAI